jgi:hypothetical protein
MHMGKRQIKIKNLRANRLMTARQNRKASRAAPVLIEIYEI